MEVECSLGLPYVIDGLVIFQANSETSITQDMGLLPDTQNCRLRMRRECRERFPPSPISKETFS